MLFFRVETLIFFFNKKGLNIFTTAQVNRKIGQIDSSLFQGLWQMLW